MKSKAKSVIIKQSYFGRSTLKDTDVFPSYIPANFEPPVSFGYRWSQENMVAEPASLATFLLLFKVPKASPYSLSAAEQFMFHQNIKHLTVC